MAFTRIADADLAGKGNLGRPDTPGVDTAEMQRILDELPREVLTPAYNRLESELEAPAAAASLGASLPAGLPQGAPATVQGALDALAAAQGAHAARADNPHAVTAAQAGAYTKAETDAAIDAKVAQIGAADMAKAVYDPTHREEDVFAAIDTARAKADSAVQSVNGKTGPAVTLAASDVGAAADNTRVVTSFGQFGIAQNGALEIYGKILAVRLPGGLWRVDFTGKIETNNADGLCGLSLETIQSALGVSVNAPDNNSAVLFAYSDAEIFLTTFGYSGTLQNWNISGARALIAARYYSTDGKAGGYSMPNTTGILDVGTYWQASFYLQEQS